MMILMINNQRETLSQKHGHSKSYRLEWPCFDRVINIASDGRYRKPLGCNRIFLNIFNHDYEECLLDMSKHQQIRY